MKSINKNEGFGAVAVIITVTILAIIGGGTFYAVNKDRSEVQEKDTEQTTNQNENSEESKDNQTSGIASINTLMGFNKNIKCEISSSVEGSTSNGTVLISDQKMRGTYTSNTQAGAITSNMLKVGEEMYVWSNSEGVKMNLAEIEAQTNSANNQPGQPSPNPQNNADLEAEYSYHCEDWSPDESQFVVPSDVEFLDLSEMLKGAMPGGLPMQ